MPCRYAFTKRQPQLLREGQNQNGTGFLWLVPISGAIEYFNSKEPRGEFTLVVAGKTKEEREVWTEEKLLKAIKKELKADNSAKEISAELAEQSGWNKKEVYALINTTK